MRNLLMNKKGEGEFKTMIFALVLFVGLTWLILSIVTGVGTEYGKDLSTIGNGSMNIANFKTTAENISSSTHVYRSQLDSGNIENVDSPTGIWALAKKFISLVTTPFTLLGQILVNLGVPELIINVFLGLLVIGLLLTAWAVLRAGS